MRAKVGTKSAILEMLIITGLKSYTILSIVDRNVAIFTTRHAISRYEFQGQIIAKFTYILLPQIKYDCFDLS